MGKGADKPKASKQEKALAAVASKKFEVYKRLYRPLAKESLKRSTATEGKIKEQQGIVNADIQQNTSSRDGDINAAGLRAGLQADDNRVLFARGKNQDAISSVRGQGMAVAREGMERRETEGKLSHIALGHGIARQSMQSLTGLARDATAESLQRSRIKTTEANQFATTLGQAGGLAYGMNPDAFQGFGGAARPRFSTSQLNAGGRSMR